MPIRRPCIECGRLNDETRCIACDKRHQAVRNARREHYRGAYRQNAKAVRQAAVVCALCGKGAKINDPWTADHIIPGNPASPLRAAHRSCNSRRGARATGI